MLGQGETIAYYQSWTLRSSEATIEEMVARDVKAAMVPVSVTMTGLLVLPVVGAWVCDAPATQSAPAPATTQPAKDPAGFSVATYNINYGNADLKLVVETLVKVDADFVCLQETNRTSQGSTWRWKHEGIDWRYRLDYIFCSKHFRPHASRIITSNASDHYLVVSTFRRPKQEGAPTTRPTTAAGPLCGPLTVR